MKKIYNHLVLKLTSYKIIIILTPLLLYHFALFINLLSEANHHNIFDLFITQFNYFPLFIVYSLGYLLIIYNVNQKTNFYKYYYLKFNNKSEVYNINVITLLIISIIFTLLINLFSFAEGIATLPLENLWSDYFYHIMGGTKDVFSSLDSVQILTRKITPSIYVLLINLYVILYFFLEGLLYFVIDSFLNKDGLSLVVVIFINTINRFFDSLGGIIPKLSFTNNIYFISSPVENIANYSFILFRILYWFILIFTIYIIGRVRTIRSDYKFLD
ncbi:hypothetical protein [Clostridium uliginosum]|uniref:ABC-2 type transport system permease protein n=1 Tax=Clostridium uliginosum TaxID=119641 RepID=A0A1I1R971_9CLOT|nr:hypothetical protein [Clostridium uliginosum]SFD28093.1 hypothetical protein SAMN05421842_12927 [Clostridium uliginosum]